MFVVNKMIESNKIYTGKTNKQKKTLHCHLKTNWDSYISETFSFGLFGLLLVNLRHFKRACPISSPPGVSLLYLTILWILVV